MNPGTMAAWQVAAVTEVQEKGAVSRLTTALIRLRILPVLKQCLDLDLALFNTCR